MTPTLQASVSHSPVAVGLKRKHCFTIHTFCVSFSLFKRPESLPEKGEKGKSFFLGSVAMISVSFELTIEKGPREAFTDISLNRSLFVS